MRSVNKKAKRKRGEWKRRSDFVGLVACGSEKEDFATEAKKLYIGGIAKRPIAWMERNCKDWFILSAKHGLLAPDHVTEPYNKRLKDLTKEERRTWGEKIRTQLRHEKRPILYLGPDDYFRYVNEGTTNPIPITNIFGKVGANGAKALYKRQTWLTENPVLKPRIARQLGLRTGVAEPPVVEPAKATGRIDPLPRPTLLHARTDPRELERRPDRAGNQPALNWDQRLGTSPGPRSRSKTMSKKATTPAKASKSKAEQPAKSKAAATEQPAKAKPAKAEKPAKQPSNKERVYRQWEKSSEKSPKEAEALAAKAKVTEVKVTTIRGWISSWNNGANLPGCAKN